MKKTRESNRRRRSVREILNDRALMVAFFFSAVVHLVVIYQVTFPRGDAPPKTARLMIARLVRLPAAVSGEEERAPHRGEPAGIEIEDRPAAPAVQGAAPEEGKTDAKIGVAAAGSGGTTSRTGKVSGRLSLFFSPSAPAFGRQRSSPAVGAAGGARAHIARPEASERSDHALLNEIRRLIDTRKVYPRIALRNGWEGRVLVELRLADGGTLEDVQIVDASGYRVLDSATVRAVRSAGPYPPLAGKVRVPVTYRLER